ncbi:fatty acid synthase subunit alpha, partial [Aureobasidium sp. EXF-3399]
MAIVGGSDDFQEEMSYEFARMKATCSTSAELGLGKLPSEMSRSCSTSRSGFVESAGCGVQIIMTAEKALEMGLPIYGIVVMTQMVSDKIGRSVPAPGQGILTAAREDIRTADSPLLDSKNRRHRFDREMRHWHQQAVSTRSLSDTQRSARVRMLQRMWANDLREQEPGISPIRSALATWDPTVDDIQVASLHGTSTKANDVNETDVVKQQVEHLGRSPAAPLLVVCQKSSTGHPKGAAGAWQLNGCVQMLRTGIVPGNRNADNIEQKLEQRNHLIFPGRPLQTQGINATMLTSFEFGRKGGIVIMVHSKYLFAAISKDTFDTYKSVADQRRRGANQAYIRAMLESRVVRVKEKSSWAETEEKRVFLDPSYRHGVASVDRKSPYTVSIAPDSDTRHPDKQSPTSIDELESTIKLMSKAAMQSANNATIGIDVEDLSSINLDNQVFLERNFTVAERAYCDRSADRRASYAGKWAAKEAVFKCLQVPSRGAGASMIEIEILNCDDGHPEVKTRGKATEAMTARSVSRFEISVAHTETTAVAIATATKC